MGTCWWRKGSILLMFFLLSFINSSGSIKFSESEPNGARLELIHRHSLRMRHVIKGKEPMPNQLERLKDLLEQDGIRQQAILHRLRLRQQQSNHATSRKVRETKPVYNVNSHSVEEDYSVSIEMPLRAGADYGAGQYFVSLKAGTPAQKFLVIADTGSDLTWMNCRYRCGSARHRRTANHRRVFCADHSSSFRTFPCSSRMCKIDLMNLFSLARCPTPLTPCAYDYRYSDGSAAMGLFANETITVQLTNGRKAKLHNVLVGCSETSRGPTVQLADGVLGLGYSNHSFAIKAAEKFGGKFSYCLVDHLSPKNVSNYLVFGTRKEEATFASNNNMQYTKLILGVINPFYAINVNGISLGGVMLNIPDGVWDVNGAGGTILDSGTSLTFLTRPAYQPVMAALKLSLSKFKKLELEIGPLEYCFDSTGFDESMVPRLEFHFTDGARYGPPVKNYVIDAAKGVKCLGIVSAGWPGTSVIGNIMQQNHIWEFDLINNRLGFSASTCT